MRARTARLCGGAVLGSVLISGCAGSSTPEVTAAPSAGDAGCTALLPRLPATLLGRGRTTATVAGSATWGDPAIVLRCGVTPPGPSADACVEVDDTDWLFTEDQTTLRFTTYGRTPAVELAVPAGSVDRTQASGALAELAAAVRPLTVSRRCVGLDDT